MSLYFDALKQGRVGLIGITGNTENPQATVFERPLNFFQVPGNEGWFSLIVASIDQSPRTYEIRISYTIEGNEQSLSAPFEVVNGGFVQQNVIVVGEGNELLNREIEDAELQHIFDLAKPITPIVYWQDKPFGHPVDTELTSPFGAQRVFNGLYDTLHTGWDYNAPTGKPFVASAPAQVAFAGHMDIRGNYVLLDHGYGIYSGYAHLSVIYVTQGQLVDAGQIIGLVGTTGRSSSAHAHFEMLVDTLWVDSTDFINMPLPH